MFLQTLCIFRITRLRRPTNDLHDPGPPCVNNPGQESLVRRGPIHAITGQTAAKSDVHGMYTSVLGVSDRAL